MGLGHRLSGPWLEDQAEEGCSRDARGALSTTPTPVAEALLSHSCWPACLPLVSEAVRQALSVHGVRWTLSPLLAGALLPVLCHQHSLSIRCRQGCGFQFLVISSASLSWPEPFMGTW